MIQRSPRIPSNRNRARPSLYQGRAAALATMHGKEEAIAPPFAELLGVEVTVPEYIDTDALGTFTGETERPGDMLETARIKAEVGIELTGGKLAIASEGAYGPHPFLPYVASGSEIVIWLDTDNGIEVCEQSFVRRTNYTTLVLRPGEAVGTLLERADFPRHALIVMPRAPDQESPFAPVKGIRDTAELRRAIRAAAAASTDGFALVQSDMRAHMNPTRMHAISVVARRLASRLLARCRECDAPGFGVIRSETGLPCELCGTPTRLPYRDIHGCARCSYEVTRPREENHQSADPRHCEICNP